MKQSLILAIVCMLALPAAAATEATRFYIQLIRATDDTNSPAPGAIRIGPKLSDKFHAVFHGKTYWEVKREEVLVSPAKPAKVSLNANRTVLIEVTDDKRTVTTYYKGDVTDRTTAPRGEGMTMIGDNHGKNTCCFIVVRRDKPSP